MEILYWLQDIREHLRVSQRRKALRQPGQGSDYAAEGDMVQQIVAHIHPKRMRLRVTDIIQATASARTFRLERTDGPLPPFRPGQYVNVFVDVDGVLTSRPYSIASPPPFIPPASGGDRGGERTGSEGRPMLGEETRVRDTLELTVRDKAGGFVAPYLLNEVQVGDELETTGPAGSFYHEPLIDGDDLVFLAGGSGITPFMSIIRDAVQHDRPLKIHLFYGSRVPEDVIYGPELAELAARHPNLRYSLVISEPPAGYEGLSGFLNAELIREQIGALQTGPGRPLTGKTFYVCGPNLMYDFCLSALTGLGVPPHKIKRELYGPPDDVTADPGWPEGLSAATVFDVQVETSGQEGRGTIRAAAGEPLLNSLERHGIVVPAVCRAGECSACRTRLLSGRVFQPAHTGLRESDRQHGYIHACVSFPLGDLQIRI